MSYPVDDAGNPRIDFVHGNMPLQPNDQRENWWQKLSILDSHSIAATEWNQYPANSPDGLTGNTLTDGSNPAFYWPALGFCNTNAGPVGDVRNVIDYFAEIGVPREYFKDFTFSGGETPWDPNGEPNYDGAIWYLYIPADTYWGTDGSGSPIYGSQVEGQVAWGNWNADDVVAIDSGDPLDYSIVVITNDIRKDNAWWWW